MEIDFVTNPKCNDKAISKTDEIVFFFLCHCYLKAYLFSIQATNDMQ